MTEPYECDEVADLLAEVATGAATGPDRDRVARHLADCERCRRELDELSWVADEVLLAAPEHEPPPRFESMVLERIAAEDRSPARRPRRAQLLLAAAAAVLVAAVSAGAVWQGTASERELAAGYRDALDVADGRYFTAAPLNDDDGVQVGHVFLYDGSPSWLFVVLDPAPKAGSYDIVVTVNGAERTAGRCVVTGTGCAAGDTLAGKIADVDSVRLLGPDGTEVRADLSRPNR